MNRQRREDLRCKPHSSDFIIADKENYGGSFHLENGIQGSKSFADANSTPKAPKKKKFFKTTAKRMKLFGSLKKKNGDGSQRVVVSESLSGETAEFVTVDNMLGDDEEIEITRRKERKRKKSELQGSSTGPAYVPFRSPLLSVESSLRKKVNERRLLVAEYQKQLQYQGIPVNKNDRIGQLPYNHSMEMPSCKNRSENIAPIMNGMREKEGNATKSAVSTKNGNKSMPTGSMSNVHITVDGRMQKDLGDLQQTNYNEKYSARRNNETTTIVSELSMSSPLTKFGRNRLKYLLAESNVPLCEKDVKLKKQKLQSHQSKSEFGFCGCPVRSLFDDIDQVAQSSSDSSSSSSRKKERSEINQFMTQTASESDSTGSSDFTIHCKKLPPATSSLTSNSSDDSHQPTEDDDESCSISTGPPSFHSILYDVASRISSRKGQIQKKVPPSVSNASAATRRAVDTFRGRLAECIAPSIDSPPSVKLKGTRRQEH